MITGDKELASMNFRAEGFRVSSVWFGLGIGV